MNFNRIDTHDPELIFPEELLQECEKKPNLFKLEKLWLTGIQDQKSINEPRADNLVGVKAKKQAL